MAVIVPFRALRPAREHVGKVASCAYDVIDSDEARVLAKENPESFLHVVKSEIDLPEHIDPYDRSVYEKARENLEKLVKEKILSLEDKPCFYVYRQKMGSHVQHGIVACADISEYVAGRIKKHELTRAEKEADRTRHIDVVDAQMRKGNEANQAHKLLERRDRLRNQYKSCEKNPNAYKKNV